MEADKSKKSIQWHPAFVVALQGLLIDYSDVLEYKLEHPLTTGSMAIDVIVVKKRPDATVKRQIAEIFRHDNIMEYKNPTVSLSVNEFHKSYARAHLYKALDDIDIGGLTLSFVAAAYPRELFRYLRETLGCAVEERHPGIYWVSGAMMPIQIIDIRKLSDDENLWLRSLNRNLTGKNLLWAHVMEQKHGSRLDMKAWMQAVFAANHGAVKEIFNNEGNRMLTAGMRKTLEEIGLGEIWRQEGKLEGRQEGERKGERKGRLEGKLEDAQAMFAEGDSLEKIARITGISRKTLKAALFKK